MTEDGRRKLEDCAGVLCCLYVDVCVATTTRKPQTTNHHQSEWWEITGYDVLEDMQEYKKYRKCKHRTVYLTLFVLCDDDVVQSRAWQQLLTPSRQAMKETHWSQGLLVSQTTRFCEL